MCRERGDSAREVVVVWVEEAGFAGASCISGLYSVISTTVTVEVDGVDDGTGVNGFETAGEVGAFGGRGADTDGG